jgi:hypothetical protein
MKGNITMNWKILYFGKHKGKTLPEIVLSDPGWFFWAWKNDILKVRKREEWLFLYRRAKAIKIPDVNGVKMQAKYLFTKNGRRELLEVELVPVSDGNVDTEYEYFRDYLDLELTWKSQIGRAHV